LSIVDNAPGSPQTVSLAGNGLVVVQTIVVTPTSMDFPDQVVGTVSNNNQSVTLINTGNVLATISNIAVSGDFSVSQFSCGSVPILLGPGQSCSLTINFAPTAAGSRTGALTITDNAVGSPHTVALAGNGESGELTVNVTPTGLGFPDTAVNSTSNAQQVSITNTGNTPVGVSRVTTTGDFALNSNFGCNLPAILQVGQTCSFNVNFTPTATGVRNGTLSFNDDATGSPQTVALTGKGVAANLAIAITPSNMDFGPVTLGAASPDQSAIVRNIGNEPVLLSSVVVSAGDFSLDSNGCGALQPSQECNVQLAFAPTAAGARTGSVTFTDNAQGSPQTMTLTGQGTSATPSVTLSPPEGIFDAQPVGTPSYSAFTYLYNNSKGNLTISSVVPSGDFALAFNYCTGTLVPTGSCYYGVTFTPTAGGIRTGKITITDSDPS